MGVERAAAAHSGRVRRLPATIRREQILDAAITAFAGASFREVSTAGIAAALGVSEPTLFRHFPTKRALYLAAIDRSAETLIDRWRAIAAAAPSPRVALVEIGRWYFGALQEDSRHLRLRFRSCSETRDAAVLACVQAHFRTVYDFVHGLYEAARTRGEIAAGTDVRAHTWLFVAIGALIDVTQLADLRQDLSLDVLPSVFMLAQPKPQEES
jgi:AcrR family transcriptional regulator